MYPAHAPLARAHHAVAYDTARDRVVLLGGEYQFGRLADTWEFDGDDWHEHSERAPANRSWHALVYDRGASCGDGTCAPAERCGICPADCGAICPAECGNFSCESGESCGDCPGDCGGC